jgi:hypothetical protein
MRCFAGKAIFVRRDLARILNPQDVKVKREGHLRRCESLRSQVKTVERKARRKIRRKEADRFCLFSQPLRAGLTCVAPTALGKRTARADSSRCSE